MVCSRLALVGLLLLIAFTQAQELASPEEIGISSHSASNGDSSASSAAESTEMPSENSEKADRAPRKSIYDHVPLKKLTWTFKSESLEMDVTPGKMMNFSFPHLAPFLHHESTQHSWIVAFFHVPSWPLTSIMLPRVDYVAQQFPNITFLSVDCSNVSSMALLNWDLSGLPSFVIYNSQFNLADHTGTGTSSTLTLLLKTFTDIEPVKVEKPDFDDITLRTDDLPRFDPKLVEYMFALFWGLRWLLSKTAMLGPLLNF